jgi:potassium voltage-gated channel Eag-related subfamily H protein 7
MKLFIRSDGKFRFWWDIGIIVATTYSVWKVPIKVAFEPASLNTPAMALVDSLIDFFYLMDVLVTFRTTYMDLLANEQVTDSYRIATRYISSGNFFIDFLSSIPLDTITGVRVLNIVGLLKLFRYRKLADIIRTANVKTTIKV